MVDVHRVVNGTSLDLAPGRDELVFEEACSDMTGAARARWPDFGRTTMKQQRKTTRVGESWPGRPAAKCPGRWQEDCCYHGEPGGSHRDHHFSGRGPTLDRNEG